MALQKGDQAPLFTLISSENTEVSLSDFAGKNILLLFFPFAFTGVCTEELCSTRDSITQYNNMNCEVIGISVDSPFSLAQFKEKENLNFTLLSDFNKKISKQYGCIYEEFVLNLKGVSKRSAFVINKNGKIEYAEVLENAEDIPDFESVKNVLQSL